MKKKHKILILLNLYRTIPAYFVFKYNKFKEKCKLDLAEWKKSDRVENLSDFIAFSYFLTSRKEFRNLLLNRLHRNPIKYFLTRILFIPEKTLYINMPPEKVGGGGIHSTWIFYHNCG